MAESLEKQEIFLILSPSVLMARLQTGAKYEVGTKPSVVNVYRNREDEQEYQATHVVNSQAAYDKLKTECPDAVLMLRANKNEIELVTKGHSSPPSLKRGLDFSA